MPTADRILTLKLLGDVASIDKSLKGTQGKLKKTASAAGSWVKAAGIGLAIEGVSMLGDALGEAWTGFRDGEKASAQLGSTWKNLHMDGSKLQGTIDAIGESTLKLGTDDVEAINTFNQSLQRTGDSRESMKRLAIAQDVAASKGISLGAAMKIVDGAAKGSAKTVDAFGLTSKTAGGRVKELGEKVKGAAKHAADMDPLAVSVNAIKEGLEGIVGSLSTGDLDGAMTSLEGIGTAISTAFDGLAPKVGAVVDKLTGGSWTNVTTALQGIAEKFGPKVAGVLDAMGKAWDALQPHLENALKVIQPVVDILGSALGGGLSFVLDSVKGSLQAIADLLNGDFDKAWTDIGTTIGTLASDLNTFFFGLPDKIAGWAVDIATEASLLGMGILNGIISWVTGDQEGALLPSLTSFFTGLPGVLGGWVEAIGTAAGDIGKSIWDGIVDEVSGIAAKVSGMIGTMAAGLANVWNSVGTFPAGGFTFAEAFSVDILGQKVGWPKIAMEWGAGDLIPNIDVPKLAKGGTVRHTPGGTLALLGEGGHDERVTPLDGRQTMGGGPTYNIHVSVAPGGDLVLAGKQIVEAIRQYERRSGKVWRSA